MGDMEPGVNDDVITSLSTLDLLVLDELLSPPCGDKRLGSRRTMPILPG
jgi:hypothetical protein